MKKIYVCSPYGGLDENYEQARKYGKYIVSLGHIPIISYTMLHGILEDHIPSQRETGLTAGKILMTLCDEVWVFGDRITPGMAGEIMEAGKLGIKIQEIKKLPDEITKADSISLCLKEYGRYFRGFVTPQVAWDIQSLIEKGITYELIIAAMKKAARKSAAWNYAYGILKNCLSQQIYTAEEFEIKGKRTGFNDDFSTHNLDEIERILDRGYGE